MKLHYSNLFLTFLTLLLIVFIGFFPSYFSQDVSKFSFWINLHATSMLIWFGLLFAQAYLIKRGKLKIHRLLGNLSWILLLVITTSTLFLAYGSVLKGIENGKALIASGFFLIPVTDLLLFITMYLLAIFFKKNHLKHITFILLATIALLPPALIRIYFNYFSKVALVYPLLTIVLSMDVLVLVILILKARKNLSLKTCIIFSLSFPLVHIVRHFLVKLPSFQKFIFSLIG